MRKFKRKLTKKKIFVSGIALLLVGALGTGLFVWNSRNSVDRIVMGKTFANTIRLEKQDLVTSISATGTIESAKQATVSASVQNVTVKKWNVSVGDTVSEGDVLLVFDLSDLKESLSEAKENLSDAKEEAAESVAEAEENLSDAKEEYNDSIDTQASKVSKAKTAWTDAKAEVTALQKKIKSASAEEKKALQEELTKAQEAVSQAKSSYESALQEQKSAKKQSASSVKQAEKELKNTKSQTAKSVKEAKKQVEEIQEQIDNCSVTAPTDGVVTSISVSEGDIYSGGALAVIQSTDDLQVTSSVDEYDINDVAVGQRVVILTEATGDDELEGEITFVAPSKDSTSSVSSSSSSNSAGMSGNSSSTSSSSGYEIVISVKSVDERLKLGLTAKCSIIKEEVDDVFAVPYDAVHEDQDGTKYIYVDESATNERPGFGSEDASSESGDSNSDSQSKSDSTNSEVANGTDSKNANNSSDTLEENYTKVTVEVGMESDYYIEISGDDLKEGMRVVIPTDETETKSDSKDSDSALSSLFGGGHSGQMGDMGGGAQGGPGGNPPSGGGR